jgi:hypothetical protein
LLTVSPKAHTEKRWCAGVVPVDLIGWAAFTASQERGFYRIDDPRNVDVLELHRQVREMVLEVLGPERPRDLAHKLKITGQAALVSMLLV